MRSAYDLLSYAHRHHHAIVEAIQARDAARAEALLREHAKTQEASLNVSEPDSSIRQTV